MLSTVADNVRMTKKGMLGRFSRYYSRYVRERVYPSGDGEDDILVTRDKMAGILNVTVDYTKESGGSALSVQQFSQALGAQTVSLTRPSSLSASGSYSDCCIHIPVDDTFSGNAYSYLSKTNAQQLRVLIRNANLGHLSQTLPAS